MPFRLSVRLPRPVAIVRPVAVSVSPLGSLALASNSACVIRRAPLSSAMAASVTGPVLGAVLVWIVMSVPKARNCCGKNSPLSRIVRSAPGVASRPICTVVTPPALETSTWFAPTALPLPATTGPLNAAPVMRSRSPTEKSVIVSMPLPVCA